MEEAIDFRQNSDENKVIKQVVDDWNEVDIKCISEIYLAVEVRLIDYNKESSSDVSTPFSKRKEGDAELSDMNSTSKKLRAQSIKVEKIKED
ncbi:hypothetical protein Bca4012_052128 [Brassica carinata]